MAFFKQKTYSVNDSITLDDIITNIQDAFDSLDGEQIAKIHNKISNTKIKYNGDSEWIVTGTDY